MMTGACVPAEPPPPQPANINASSVKARRLEDIDVIMPVLLK